MAHKLTRNGVLRCSPWTLTPGVGFTTEEPGRLLEVQLNLHPVNEGSVVKS